MACLTITAAIYGINRSPQPQIVNEPYLPLELQIFSPENQTYRTSDIYLNFSINKSAEKFTCILDGQVLLSKNQTVSKLSNGGHNLTIYGIEIESNVSKKIAFTVEKPTVEEAIRFLNQRASSL